MRIGKIVQNICDTLLIRSSRAFGQETDGILQNCEEKKEKEA